MSDQVCDHLSAIADIKSAMRRVCVTCVEIGDRWVHLDSAYPGIPRSCYLKLGTTSGADDRHTSAAMATAFATVLGKEVERLTP